MLSCVGFLASRQDQEAGRRHQSPDEQLEHEGRWGTNSRGHIESIRWLTGGASCSQEQALGSGEGRQCCPQGRSGQRSRRQPAAAGLRIHHQMDFVGVLHERKLMKRRPKRDPASPQLASYVHTTNSRTRLVLKKIWENGADSTFALAFRTLRASRSHESKRPGRTATAVRSSATCVVLVLLLDP